MQLSKEEFQRLGHAAVDMASEYLTGLPARPVFQYEYALSLSAEP